MHLLVMLAFVGFACISPEDLPSQTNALPSQAPAQQGRSVRTVRISGRFNPELIPQQMLWETFFREMATAATDEPDLPREKRVQALSKYSMKIPVDDVEIVIQIAVHTVQAIDDIRKQLTDEHAESHKLSLDDRRSLLAKSSERAMQGRDELVKALSSSSFINVRTWVTEDIIKGIEVELPVEQ